MSNDRKGNFSTARTALDGVPIVGRRHLLRSMVGVASICLLPNSAVMAQDAKPKLSKAELKKQYDDVVQALLSNTEILEAARGERERQTLPMRLGLTAASRPIPSATPISKDANDLIVRWEVSDESTYIRKLQRPTLPGVKSGVTIGIGYDIGYVNKDELKEDWKDFISSDVIETLSAACGKLQAEASGLLPFPQDIVVSWPAAHDQYVKKTVPNYTGETEAALPNTNLLSPDSLGALVSLVLNRGASFNVSPARDPTGRYEEMRNIKAHMSAKEFDKIPDEFRAMKRIWADDPNARGLLPRRDAEALLFEIGLAPA